MHHYCFSFQVALNKIHPSSINNFSFMLNYYIAVLILPGFIASIVLLMLYYRNQPMRRFIVLELQGWFGKLIDDLTQLY